MYTLVRRYIKTSIIFLFVGLLMGAHLIFLKEVRGIYPDFKQITAHSHLILIGFVMMMIMGIALWMFPRPKKEKRRYSPDMAHAIFWVMTVSVSARFLGEAVSAWVESEMLSWVITISSFLEILGIFLFFFNIWTRIRPVGSHIREAKGEKF